MLIDKAIHTVTKNLLEGGLIVMSVLLLLLGNWRVGLVVASVIPLGMLFALGMMHVFGVWANLMSLGAIDFVLLVDGGVIIVESMSGRVPISSVPNGPRRLVEGVFSRQLQFFSIRKFITFLEWAD